MASQKTTSLGCGGFIAILFVWFIISKSCESKIEDKTSLENTTTTYTTPSPSHDWLNDKDFMRTKAGKIYRKHQEWSVDDCQMLAKGQIWIGMSIDMVVYLRGRPNVRNDSNYGNGNEYQYCWTDYNPSCFYCKADGIVYSYN